MEGSATANCELRTANQNLRLVEPSIPRNGPRRRVRSSQLAVRSRLSPRQAPSPARYHSSRPRCRRWSDRRAHHLL